MTSNHNQDLYCHMASLIETWPITSSNHKSSNTERDVFHDVVLSHTEHFSRVFSRHKWSRLIVLRRHKWSTADLFHGWEGWLHDEDESGVWVHLVGLHGSLPVLHHLFPGKQKKDVFSKLGGRERFTHPYQRTGQIRRFLVDLCANHFVS